MDSRALVDAFFTAFEAGDYDTAASYLSNDFQFSGATPEPISGQAWIGLSASMRAAFPDLRYNFQVESVEGDVVTTSNQLHGTHTEDFDLSAMGMGVIPPTGKSFSLPQETNEATVHNGKLAGVHVFSTPGSGLAGILSQLGIPVS
jgi:predicted ester cyclase